VERAYGKFERSFTLPEKADAAKVNAEFKDGVLQVRLPKMEKTSSTAKEVKIS
jgi:HSP20 family protein